MTDSPYAVPCQRCGKRNAVQGRISNERCAWVFAAATGLPSNEVRLCSSCKATVDSLTRAVAQTKPRKKSVP